MTNGTINDLITFLQYIIPISAAARIAHCLILISAADESEQISYKKRAKNALYFAICAECIVSAIKLLSSYFLR